MIKELYNLVGLECTNILKERERILEIIMNDNKYKKHLINNNVKLLKLLFKKCTYTDEIKNQIFIILKKIVIEDCKDSKFKEELKKTIINIKINKFSLIENIQNKIKGYIKTHKITEKDIRNNLKGIITKIYDEIMIDLQKKTFTKEEIKNEVLNLIDLLFNKMNIKIPNEIKGDNNKMMLFMLEKLPEDIRKIIITLLGKDINEENHQVMFQTLISKFLSNRGSYLDLTEDNIKDVDAYYKKNPNL